MRRALGGERFSVTLPPDGGSLADPPSEALRDLHKTWVARVTFIPWREADGGLLGVHGVAVDITDEAQVEQERAARFAAEEATRVKDEFLAMVSHELRSPLQAILGWTHVLQERPADSVRVAKWLATIERNGKALARLIEDLLDISRIVAGTLRVAHERVDPARVIEAALESTKGAADAKSIKLEVAMQPDAGVVLGDGDRLQQIVVNLLSNAVKFTPSGGRIGVRLVSSAKKMEGVSRNSRQEDRGMRRVVAAFSRGSIAHMTRRGDRPLQRKFLTLSVARRKVPDTEVNDLLFRGSDGGDAALLRRRRRRASRRRGGLGRDVTQFRRESTHPLVRCDALRPSKFALRAPSDFEATLRLERHGAAASIVVMDSGIGIAPEFLPFVFDRFRQGDTSTTRRQGGLGLGLAIVRALVEAHGGTLKAESPGVGRGTTLTVTLPVVGEDRRAVKAAWETGPERPVATPVGLDGVRVLVVDDDPDACELLELVLHESGAIVHAVQSASAALADLASFSPHVLLSDVGMPGQDGYELIRRLRARESSGGRHLPAVALSAFASAADREQALRCGFETHVAKPASLRDLVNVIATVVGRAA